MLPELFISRTAFERRWSVTHPKTFSESSLGASGAFTEAAGLGVFGSMEISIVEVNVSGAITHAIVCW